MLSAKRAKTFKINKMAKKRTYIIINSNPDEKQFLQELAKKEKRTLSNYLKFAAYYYATSQEKKLINTESK